MSLNAKELIEAMPINFDETQDTSQQSLDKLLSSLSKMPVPVSRLTRMWALGSMQAKVAIAYFAYWMRSGFVSGDDKQRLLNETHLKAAFKLLGGMSYLRGAIMKVGQVIASTPNVAPQEFVEVLGRLQFEAPSMHFSLLREFVHGELHHDPEELFDDFETTAFAAASLGQVHRATLKGLDEKVAIKIQYPNISRTIHEDFKNLKAATFPMRLTRDWDNIQAQFEEICDMLGQETDYEQEAENLRAARLLFTEDEGIIVPQVYPELSTKRILTMSYFDGLHLDEFLTTNPSQALRDEFGRKIVRSSFRIGFRGKMLYGDPHPGNYYFMPDGRLGLIDFGCCRHYNDAEMDYMDSVEQAYLTSREAVYEAIIRATDLTSTDASRQDHMRLGVEYADWVWEPVQQDGPFDFANQEYFTRGVAIFSELIKKRYTRSKPINTWLTRNVYGIRAILARLGACIDFGEIYREEARVTKPKK